MERIELDKRKRRADGTYPIVIYVRHNDKIRIATGMNAPESFKGRFTKDMDSNSTVRNAELSNMLSTVIAELSQLRISGELAALTDSELHTRLKKLLFGKEVKQRKEHKVLLSEVFARFIEFKNGNTANLYRNTLSKINAFDPEAALQSIDLTWLRSFEKHLTVGGLKINTIAIDMRNIRAVMNYAIDEGMTEHYPFRKFRIKREETEHRALSVEELRKLFTMDLDEYQKKYVDVFKLIFFLMGINISDLMDLKLSDLNRGRISYHRNKTNKLYSIKVEPEAEEIIHIYKGKNHLLCFADEYKDQTTMMKLTNKALKKVGRYDIEKRVGGHGGKKLIEAYFPKLSTYWARHTWATIAAEIGIPIETIGLCLGHNVGSKITNIYIKYNPAVIDEANRRVMDYVLYDKK